MFPLLVRFLRFLMGFFGLETEPNQKSLSKINDLPSKTPPESPAISHPSFPFEYSARNASSFTLYQKFGDGYNVVQCLSNDGESLSWSKNIPKLFKYNKVLASCNSFILCTKTYSHSGYPYHVYNLVTKKWFPIKSEIYSDGRFPLWGIVCCDMSSRSANYDLTQIIQFKVVKLVRDSETFLSNVLKIEIFDSATNQWDLIIEEFDGILTFSAATANALEHRGILYWRSEIEGDEVLLAFDSNLDTCVVIPLPGITVFHNVLGVSQNHLYYAALDSSFTSAIIWRYDGFEGEKTWSIHRKFLLDWIDKDLFACYTYLLAIDPVDCNVLIVSSSDLDTYNGRVYSLNLASEVATEISSSASVTNKPICRVLPYIGCTEP